jgi:NAD(P)-dependent dehydrogenase (short-subunit alcohol dehydrogenase family)
MSASIPSPVLLIFGAGPNIGRGVANAFAARGYKVAIVSRRQPGFDIQTRGFFHVKGNLEDPSFVETAYQSVSESLGVPSVVVYNGEFSVRESSTSQC